MKLNSHISIVVEEEEEETREMGLLSDHLRRDDDHRGVGEDVATPKLSLFSLPKKPPEPPGMLTPPLHTTVSVPFQWEEAPGRPRPSSTGDSKPPSARCLDLPPRLVNEAKVTTMPSPTTVLDGPYVGRSLSNKWSFRLGGSFRSPDGTGSKRLDVKDNVLLFGSTRWAPLKEKGRDIDNGEAAAADPFSILEQGGSGDSRLLDGETKVKISRVKRGRSLLKLSHTKSNLWASIYESIKQVVPWRRRQKKTADEHHQEMFG